MDKLDFYLGTKLIQACPMTNFGFACLSNRELSIEEFEKTRKIEDGYRVVYEGGYNFWSPKKPFEEAYSKVNGVISHKLNKEFKSIDELIEEDDKFICAIPNNFCAIPNNLGINLCSVKGIEYNKLEDGQLLSLSIIFEPKIGESCQ